MLETNPIFITVQGIYACVNLCYTEASIGMTWLLDAEQHSNKEGSQNHVTWGIPVSIRGGMLAAYTVTIIRVWHHLNR